MKTGTSNACNLQKKSGLQTVSLKNVAIRKNVTKYRLSNHKLMIKDGRIKKLNADERFCPFCGDAIKEEMEDIIEDYEDEYE